MPNLIDIAAAIKIAINAQKITEYPRPYLGMSQLGNPCARRLWMYFRWAATTTYKHKSKRIFKRGDLEEDRVIGYWEDVGIKILSRQRTLTACDGHLRGHTDGLVTNVPELEEEVFVGEIKTMQQKYFVPLTKKGLKDSKPEYYAQAQVYMHYEQAKYCLHHTTNKNDEDMYVEIVEYDPAYVEPLIRKAEDIIKTPIPPPKVSNDPTYWLCQWCDFYGPCQLEDKFLRTCRSCQSAKPAEEGTWDCNEHNKKLSLDDQKAACPKYDSLKV